MRNISFIFIIINIITTRRRDQQQPEIRLHSPVKSPQVITYVSLLFEVVESGVIYIRISTLWSPQCQISFYFFGNIWNKKGQPGLSGLMTDSEWCPGTAVSMKAKKVSGRNR